MRQKLSLKARALRYLSGREYSRPELYKKLRPYAESEDELETVLGWLQKCGYLSDQRFAESLVHRMQNRYGNQRILYELTQHNLNLDLMAECRMTLTESEYERAFQLLQRKFALQSITPELKARMYRFLAQRGFSGNLVQRAIKSWIAENQPE
ncbi:recombination regulator RecX [Undibacterium luofuense]|uniref:Regulatory protein RecX n=1 Tax=Undibacterium luofuense TaxID=2828733 RepID=A0A941I529_9BURK|nr:recombination regulator RecX [Undibacterium luofuense]MBR7781151.1 recombination regulator RecX [Undibacterium luofuense]